MRESGMPLSEVMTIMIMSKRSEYTNFTTFFFEEKDVLKDLFSQLVSFSRFVEREKRATLLLSWFLLHVLQRRMHRQVVCGLNMSFRLSLTEKIFMQNIAPCCIKWQNQYRMVFGDEAPHSY